MSVSADSSSLAFASDPAEGCLHRAAVGESQRQSGPAGVVRSTKAFSLWGFRVLGW